MSRGTSQKTAAKETTRERKVGVFKFLQFEECFLKLSFRDEFCVNGRPNRRNKAVFSNSSCVLSVDVVSHCTYISDVICKQKNLSRFLFFSIKPRVSMIRGLEILNSLKGVIELELGFLP